MLSVIIPALDEEKMISITAEAVCRILQEAKIPFEILFVDDGSRDNTWPEIEEVSHTFPEVCGIHFSRNFGKEAAMFAGLEQCRGDCCVVMDCDLQHPPEKIVEMYRLWEQGYEVIEGIKEDRGKESAFHRTAAKGFYGLISKSTGVDMKQSSDFKLLDRKVINALNTMPERGVFFRALTYWVGFRKASVSYCVQERINGTSKWSTGKLVRYALRNISSFSTAPMQIIVYLGALMLITSVVLGGIAIYQKIAGIASNGFTTVIIIQLLSGSLIMISLGIIGFYISKIYAECQRRPRYIITEICGEKKHD